MVADVSLHGGPWVVRWMLELARRNGFAVYDKPGEELAAEAMDAGGLEGEVLRALPLARTELALRRLLEQPAAWAAFAARAHSATGEEIDREVEEILADRSLWRLLHPPRVVIVGPPNVGKSTLANQLFAQERSITADLPGTTRDWVGELANVDGLAVWLIDTPGWRQTADEIEREAIGRSREQAAEADLVIMVVDATEDVERQAAQMREALGKQTKVIEVVNKCDLGKGTGGGLRTVATSGEGVEQVRKAIRAYFGCAEDGQGRARLWNESQWETLARAKRDGDLQKVFR
jgi:small GTP-binding protein